MKKLLLGSMVVALATCPTLGAKAGMPAKASDAMKRVLVEKRSYGDIQGYIPDDVVSKYERFYYNTNGYLIGTARTGRNANAQKYYDTFMPTSIDKYTVDASGYTTGMTTWQWGQNDFEDYAWAA